MTLQINPKFRDLIPPLAPEELAQLEANIIADGCRNPLVAWNGVLVDGHNRYEICSRHKKRFDVIEKDFSSEIAAMVWMIDNQWGTRNLSDIDKISLARRKQELLKPPAKENQRQSKGRGKKGLAKMPNLNTRKEAAKMAGVGEKTYDAGKLVLDAVESGELPKETLDDLRQRKKSIGRVAKDLKEKKQKENRAAKRNEKAKEVEINSLIVVGDFAKKSDAVADGSVSLIFTDPPYDREASKMFPALAEFASNKLADGGSLIMYLGHLQLPAAFAAFDGKLRHWWTCACIHGGERALLREYGIRAGWKPMLWFVKGTRDDKSRIVFDTVIGDKEKSHHDWQQRETDAAYYIENLCPADGIVCDPFLGGGTTAAAAKKLKRKWCAFEINANTARIASERLAR